MFRNRLSSQSVGILVLLVLGTPAFSLGSDADTREAKVAALYQAAEKNDLVQAKALLASGVDPNAHPPGNRLNQTPLTTAVSKGHAEMVGLLLEFKSDPALEGQR